MNKLHYESHDVLSAALACLVVIALLTAVWLGVTWLAMFLYDGIVAPMFGWMSLDFWQVFGILVLLSIVGGTVFHSRSSD